MKVFTNKLTTLAGLISVSLFLLLHANSTVGQTTAARPDRGMLPGASYSVSDVENISLTNGNVNLSIPLASLPPIAGGKLNFTLNAVYNSKLWNVTRTENQMGTFYGCPTWVVDTPQLSDLGGWRISGGYTLVIRNAHEDFDYVVPQPPGTPDCEGDVQEQSRLQSPYYRVVLIGPDGAEHELRPTDAYLPYSGTREYLRGYYQQTPDTINQPMRYHSFDGSYLWVTLNPASYSTRWSVTLKDGTQVIQYSSGIQRIKDTNGNSIKIFSDTNGTHYQDEQTGREIRYGVDNKVYYQKVGGDWASIDITWGTTTVQGKLYRVNDWMESGGETGGGMSCWRDNVVQTQLSVVREIVFPVTEPTQPAQRYSFSYNSDETTTATDEAKWFCQMPSESYTRTVSKGMGGLSQMITPSGATVKYSYSKDSKHNFQLETADDIPRETITQKQVIHDGVTDTWGYNILEFLACGGTVTAPDGSVSTESCYEKDPGRAQFFGNVAGKAGLVFKSNRSGKEVVERHWTTMPFAGANNEATGSFANATFNPVVDAEYLSLLDGSGNPVKMSAKTYQFDYNGNVTQTTEYDWFDPASVSRDSAGVPTGVPAGATVLRVTSNSYYNPSTSSSSGNVYAKRSLSTGTPLILSALQQTTTGPAITQLSYDGQPYGTAPTVGNLTTQSVWADLDNKWITSSQTYGLYGNLATRIDARGKMTKFYYDDATHALPNRVEVDPQNGTGTQTSSTTYDYSTGLVTSQTDPNGALSTIEYGNQLLGGAIDPFGRPGVVKGPVVNANGSNQRHRTTNTYIDSARQVIQAADLNNENDQLLKTKTTSDMLGRVIKTEQTEDGTNYTISALKVYDQMGKITYSSNPARSAGAATDGWTRATSDTGGRVVEVASFSGASQPPATGTNANWTGSVSTTYDAQFTTVADQAGKVRRSMVDALGRLVRVDEPTAGNNLGTTSSPTQATNYTYSVLGNLLSVSQGSQTRTFTYDSLSRLRTAFNPESGTVTYTYDDNGNLLTKLDARSITTSFTYDSLNRPTLKNYSDTTPDIAYFYDSQTLPAGAPAFDRGFASGRLVAVTYGGGSGGTYRGYDARGAVLRQHQQTDAVNYLNEAAYRLNGSMQSQTYPSVPGAGDRRTVNYTNDNAGRLASLSSAATSYAPAASVSSIGYSAPGGLSSQTYGNNLIHTVTYNSRLQTNEIKLGTSGAPTSNGSITYNYGTTANNGNLQSTSYAGGGLSYTQTFGYDELNRLTTSQEGASWSQTNSYDKYGNRSIVGGTLNFTASNNRITGWSYDAAGNLLNDGAHAYTFDAENKIYKIDGISAYVYDGEGQRVRKLVNENLRFIYGIGGQQIAEFDGATGALKKEYVYGASGLLATIEPTALNANGTRYITSDHLGSPRVVTSSSAGVVSRHDYMPFGEELFSGGRTFGMGYGTTDGIRQKFTSKERDNETTLDYFGARYFSGGQGRFTSADEFWKDSQIGDPQSWNKYAYVRNNPLRYIDPSGEKATVTITTDEAKKKGTIEIKASIAIWTKDGKISKEDTTRAAREYKNNIEKAWTGSYEQNGISYDVTTTIDVQVYSSENAATNSGAQNVLEVVGNGGANFVRPGSFLGRPDTGQVSLDAGQKGIAAHEFTHLLGVDDRYRGTFLSNTYASQRSFDMKATPYDFGWAFGGAINAHRAASRQPIPQGRQWETLNAGGPSWGPPRSHTSTRELKAGRIWWR